jgi:DNA-binding transcriptional ArsR family regulator
MGEVSVNEAVAFAISPKMARALADRWRLRILEELSVRPLSPSQFVESFGGELEAIGRCFRQLADWGFIEILETQRGGHRRGGVEHVYRRIQRALFTTEVWERLPQEYREESTGSGLESYIARISEAIEAGTFDDELERHLSWDGYALDRIAWTQIVTRLDEIIFGLPDLALEAAKRMAASGEAPIPTTVGLSAFRSPTEMAGHLPRVREIDSPRPVATPFVVSAKTAKALANETRSRILMELRVRPLSPTQFMREFGGSKSYVNRCFRELAEWNYIEVVDVKTGGQRRGGKEKIYRLKQRAFFDTATWKLLPRFLRDECTAAFLHSYFARVEEAIEAKTFDAEVDRHFTWDGVALDRAAWTEVMLRLDQVLAWVPELEEEAASRIETTRGKPIPTVVGLAGFRSPKSSEITTPAQADG